MSNAAGSPGEKENVVINRVVLTAGDCTVTALPEFGGKIASIVVKGRELLQTPLAPIAPRTRTMSFDAADASGWDECLPSVAACDVPFADGVANVPDHGDLWRVEWEKSRDQGPGIRDQGTMLSLSAQCFSLPLKLERTLQLAEIENGWRLSLNYRLTNTGSTSVPWSWAAHPLFLAEAGDSIVLPDSIRTLRLEGSGGKRLGKNGDAVSWPIAKLAGGEETNLETDLSVALAADSGVGDKLFAGPLSADDNWCELVRPSAGIKIRVSFDTAATPYLGLWLCYGGWPEYTEPKRNGPKQTCVALEPATAPVDSLALYGPWTRILSGGKSDEWPMQVEIESL
jgi:galactose mutarotase-like enzyme